jgi:hypothetical protein
MATPQYLDLPHLEQSILGSVTFAKFLPHEFVINAQMRDLATNTIGLDSFSSDYLCKLFYLYGLLYAKKGHILENELRTAMLEVRNDHGLTFKNFCLYITGIQLPENQIAEMLERLQYKDEMGSEVLRVLRFSHTFPEKITLQSFFKLWAMMREMTHKMDISPFIPLFMEFIRGVNYGIHTSNDCNPETFVWSERKIARFNIVLELEIRFIKNRDFDITGRFPHTMMRIWKNEKITKESTILDRAASILVPAMSKKAINRDSNKMIAVLTEYCKEFWPEKNIQPYTVQSLVTKLMFETTSSVAKNQWTIAAKNELRVKFKLPNM